MQTKMQKLQEDISNLPEAMSVAGCGGYDTRDALDSYGLW